MKLIPLTQGQFAKVDDEDFERIKNMGWCALWSKEGRTFYACVTIRENGLQRTARMHREIMGITDPRVKVDHKNHDTLDNRRENLRPCSHTNNLANRGGRQINNTSGIRGVYWHERAGKWMAQITVSRKAIYLGLHETKESAAKAYAAANKKYFGEFGGDL